MLSIVSSLKWIFINVIIRIALISLQNDEVSQMHHAYLYIFTLDHTFWSIIACELVTNNSAHHICVNLVTFIGISLCWFYQQCIYVLEILIILIEIILLMLFKMFCLVPLKILFRDVKKWWIYLMPRNTCASKNNFGTYSIYYYYVVWYKNSWFQFY